MDEIDEEFKQAAKALASAEAALHYSLTRNMPTDPVDRHNLIMDSERTYGQLAQARARMDRARDAKYPTHWQPLPQPPEGT